MTRDTLFILAAPFEDRELASDKTWFCRDCAMLEGALLANPHWAKHVDVRRIGFARPRAEIVALLNEDHQGLPALILRGGAERANGGREINGRVVIKDAWSIADYLAAAYGGAAPHP